MVPTVQVDDVQTTLPSSHHPPIPPSPLVYCPRMSICSVHHGAVEETVCKSGYPVVYFGSAQLRPSSSSRPAEQIITDCSARDAQEADQEEENGKGECGDSYRHQLLDGPNPRGVHHAGLQFVVNCRN